MDKITVESNITADIKKVWEYYTNPDHIIKWNYPVDDWHCPSAKNDLRVGGKYFARMEAKDGSGGFDFEAVYDEVITEKSLTYTMTGGRVASAILKHTGNQTKLSVTFDPENENPIEIQKGGWQAILNNFKKYTEAN